MTQNITIKTRLLAPEAWRRFGAVAARKPKRRAEIVDMGAARARWKVLAYRERVEQVLEANRYAVSRLYHSGALFTEEGTRAGRDLLLAQRNLLRMERLLNQLADSGELPAPRKPREIEALYQEIDALIGRTSTLTFRNGRFLARLRSE